ncbi:MAG TPA: hypothetical protein VFZ66_09980 [Herpetosiphonaceae bacterium]
MRHDLEALTSDDLVLLANRGLVKRAQQEVQSGELARTIDEDAQGTVTVRWSDGIECVLPSGGHVRDGRCSCPATTICRHLLRSVLAYQQAAAQQPGSAEQPAAPQPWDPGEIADNELARSMSRAALTWARRQMDERQVIELVRSAKPSAYLHSLNCTVRFLVPGDARYTHCDCAEESPCRHVPLAVWAFRRLEPTQASGIVEIATGKPDVPAALLDEIERTLYELASVGVSGAPSALIEQLRRQEDRCRQEGLVWPAEIIAEIVQQHAAYAAHDARFMPSILAARIGELCIRSDAIRHDTGAVPQLFVRGTAVDTKTAIGTARLIGLGCGVRVRRGGVDLMAYMQDADSGGLVAVCRASTDPVAAADAPAPFWRLAETPVVQGVSIAALGAGQALVRGGYRFPNARFSPGRARLNVNPQMYAWESLRAPVLAEDFAELAARAAAQPPAALRPRRLTDGLHVCALTGARDAVFSESDQEVRATLDDSSGGHALLVHPYTSRGGAGAEALLALLRRQPESLRFVAGHVQLTARGLVIAPTAVVFQDGSLRRALQPWIDRDRRGDDAPARPVTPARRAADPLSDYWAQLGDALGDLLVVGLRRADGSAARRWQELARYGAALGFGRAVDPVTRLSAALKHKAATLHWEPRDAAEALLDLACLTQVVSGALTGVLESASVEAAP